MLLRYGFGVHIQLIKSTSRKSLTMHSHPDVSQKTQNSYLHHRFRNL